MRLDPNSSLPPYRQLADLLTAAIERGEYAPGAALPSGPELAAEVGVSRATVQSALKLLKQDGLIVARQGSGTFVREKRSVADGLEHAAAHGLPFVLCFYGLDLAAIDARLAVVAPMLREVGRVEVHAIMAPAALAGGQVTYQSCEIGDAGGWSPTSRETQLLAAGLHALGVQQGAVKAFKATLAPHLTFEFSYAHEGAEVHLREQVEFETPRREVPQASAEAQWFDQEWDALAALVGARNAKVQARPADARDGSGEPAPS